MKNLGKIHQPQDLVSLDFLKESSLLEEKEVVNITKRRLTLDSISTATTTANGNLTTIKAGIDLTNDGTLTLKSGSHNYRNMFLADSNEKELIFTMASYGMWIILGEYVSGGATRYLSVALESYSWNDSNGLPGKMTGTLVEFTTATGNGFVNLHSTNTSSPHVNLFDRQGTRFGAPVGRGDIIRLVRHSDSHVEIYITKEGTTTELKLIDINYNTIWSSYKGTKPLNRFGFIRGVSGSEKISGVTRRSSPDDKVFLEDLYAPVRQSVMSYVAADPTSKSTEIDPTTEKLAVLVIAGQSNAVGYDESTNSLKWAYLEDSRCLQLGQYGLNKNKLIPLTQTPENYQNMKALNVNRANKNYKSLHLPLAKRLLKYLPSDYKLVVVSAAYGGTGFDGTNYGTYNTINDIPTTPLNWGLNSAYYKSMKDRVKLVLDWNPDNIFIGTVWIQGEQDGSANNAANHKTRFSEMANDFLTMLRTTYPDRLPVTAGNDRNMWFNVQSTDYWLGIRQYPQILETYRTWNPLSFVDNTKFVSLPDDLVITNEANGDGTTSSIRASHFGNNGYYTFLGPKIEDKMKNLLFNTDIIVLNYAE